MGNNRLKMAYFERHLFLLLSLLLLTTITNGQNIAKHYVSSLQEGGTLYFIMPEGEFSNKKNKGKFIYDITYLTKNDTAKLNFSYFEKSNRNIDSIVLVYGNKQYSSSAKKIFIEPKNQKWHYRYSTEILFTELYTFFSQYECPQILLYTQQGVIELTIKSYQWRKQSSIINKILTMIKYNK